MPSRLSKLSTLTPGRQAPDVTDVTREGVWIESICCGKEQSVPVMGRLALKVETHLTLPLDLSPIPQ